MLSNGSRGTLMSYTDRSAQRRLKWNAPSVSHHSCHVKKTKKTLFKQSSTWKQSKTVLITSDGKSD